MHSLVLTDPNKYNTWGSPWDGGSASGCLFLFSEGWSHCYQVPALLGNFSKEGPSQGMKGISTEQAESGSLMELMNRHNRSCCWRDFTRVTRMFWLACGTIQPSAHCVVRSIHAFARTAARWVTFILDGDGTGLENINKILSSQEGTIFHVFVSLSTPFLLYFSLKTGGR